MKTLHNHIILYDKECPMCNLYTSAFIRLKMLDADGRLPFTEAEHILTKHHIDRAKACDEIALVDVGTGRVKYGTNSLMYILEYRFPFLKSLFRNKWFESTISVLYSFISFNRKVIVPGKDIDDTRACKPSFSLRYRLLYLLMTWFVASFVLARYAFHLTPLVPETTFYREFLICGGQIIFQSIVILIINRNRYFDYIGNMMTISFAGALLLLPMMALSSHVAEPIIFAGWFMFVVALMFGEHLRRTRLLNVSWVMTASWVLYRLIVLTLLLR